MQLFRDCPVNCKETDFYQVKSIQAFFDKKLEPIKQIKKANDLIVLKRKVLFPRDIINRPIKNYHLLSNVYLIPNSKVLLAYDVS